MKGKKILAGILSVIMILGTMAMPVFAAITELPQADENGIITITENADIDLNGATVNNQIVISGDVDYVNISNGTITYGEVTKVISGISQTMYDYVLIIDTTADVTLDNVKILGEAVTNKDGIGGVRVRNGGNITITNSTVKSADVEVTSAATTNYKPSDAVTIGGTVESVTITNSTITGGSSICNEPITGYSGNAYLYQDMDSVEALGLYAKTTLIVDSTTLTGGNSDYHNGGRAFTIGQLGNGSDITITKTTFNGGNGGVKNNMSNHGHSGLAMKITGFNDTTTKLTIKDNCVLNAGKNSLYWGEQQEVAVEMTSNCESFTISDSKIIANNGTGIVASSMSGYYNIKLNNVEFSTENGEAISASNTECNAEVSGELKITGDKGTNINYSGDYTLSLRANENESYVTPPAALNGVFYDSFADAYAARKDGDTIKLFKDADLAADTAFDKEITIDLNNCKLTVEPNKDKCMDVSKNVTFKNGTVDISGVTRTVAVWRFFADNTNMTFDDVDLVGTGVVSTGAAVFAGEAKDQGASLTFKNGCDINLSTNAKSLNEVGRFIIYVDDVTFDDTTVTLDGFDGAFTHGNFTFNDGSDITVKNGNYALNYARLTMNGNAKLEATGYHEDAIKLGEGSYIDLNGSSSLTIKNAAVDGVKDINYSKYVKEDYDKSQIKIDVEKNATLDANLSAVAKNATVTGKAAAVTVEFKKTAKANEYEIELSTPADYIHEFTAAQLKFAKGNDDIGYTIEGANAKINVVPQGNDVYLFSLKSGENFIGDESKIVIGKVVFEGYSDNSVDFKINEAYENKVEATKGQNITETFTVANDKLIVNSGNEGKINVSFEEPKCDVTINVDMYQNVTDNAAVYQDMKIVVTGQELDNPITYALGTDGIALDENRYSKTVTLKQNNTYVITVSGAGYRTAQYILKIKDNDTATVNFWNNVRRTGALVSGKIGDSETTAWHNFIAGDIIKDNKLDIFDLSAVVAYFGDEATNAEKTTDGWAKAKYDLNRDGKIDADDVSIVLNAWKGLELLNN